MKDIINISKILKFELFLLFILTALSFIAFYYQNDLPDHYLSISSRSDQFSFLTYSLTSAIVFIGYYTGPWVFIPFIIFSLFYTFQFSRRELLLDIFNVITLSLGTFFLTAHFFSDFAGEGASFLIKKKMSTFALLGLGHLLIVAFLWGSFRSSFQKFLFSFFHLTLSWRALTWRAQKFSFKFSPLSFINKRKEGDVEVVPQPQVSPPLIEEKKSAPLSPTLPLVRKKKNNQENKNESRINYRQLLAGALSSKNSKKMLRGNTPADSYFQDIIERIEIKLTEFKIEGNIINVLKGPVVDTFELELGSGVKVSKVLNHEADLSLALYGVPIRIVYPMSGKTTIGIEVPRDPRDIIYLGEVLQSRDFQSVQHKLPLAMGKNAFGEIFVVDLANMPHMLVAGATGAGKSVFINSLLVSLLVKKSPDQMKLILIDPKQLELALYHGLPHLMMPVITGAKEASLSLLWACQEMERRYSILKNFGVRNIESFNEKLKTASSEKISHIQQYYENEPGENYELPYLVIIVDEFADLMLTKVCKEIEENISRLAAKARAAGIHLVLATQRPSVDVITGVIKSNFPTRVAFKVTSQQDSRTILTTIGAEKLLGKGDGLFRNSTENIRFHSSYIEEEEIETLVEKLGPFQQSFHGGAMEFLESEKNGEVGSFSHDSDYAATGSAMGRGDEKLFKRAVDVVIEHQTASASMLQRRLRIGYNRAALLIEEMEAQGIVGTAQGSRRREVLLTSKDKL